MCADMFGVEPAGSQRRRDQHNNERTQHTNGNVHRLQAEYEF